MVKHVAVSLTLISAVAGHMQLNYPPTFNASNNPHTTGTPDPYLYYPYGCCGRSTPFPCRGYLSLLGQPEGAPVASWPAGSQQNFSLTGIGNHYGGSCQVGFSIDQGKTFKVATSFEGNCPHRDGGVDPAKQTFSFTVPPNLPAGEVVFAWTWTNREQEFFMNCAAVNITGAGSATTPSNTPIATSTIHTIITSTATSLPSALQSDTGFANAAPSYNMNGCSCTCPEAAQLDHDNQYTIGGCTCTCPTLPPTAGADMINKRSLNIDSDNLNCLCASYDSVDQHGRYTLHDCGCSTKRSTKPLGWGTLRMLKRVLSNPVNGAETRLRSKHLRLLNANNDRAAKFERKRTIESFNSLPSMFFGDMNDGCETPHTTPELKYPEPGTHVVPRDGVYPLALPSGPAC